MGCAAGPLQQRGAAKRFVAASTEVETLSLIRSRPRNRRVDAPEPAKPLNSETSGPTSHGRSAPWAPPWELYGFIPGSTAPPHGGGARTAPQTWIPAGAQQLAIHVRPARGKRGVNRLGYSPISSTASWESRFPHRARWLLTGSAGVTSITASTTLALRLCFGEPKPAIAKPGQYSLIPYAGLRVINASWGHRRACAARSRPAKEDRAQGSSNAPGLAA